MYWKDGNVFYLCMLWLYVSDDNQDFPVLCNSLFAAAGAGKLMQSRFALLMIIS